MMNFGKDCNYQKELEKIICNINKTDSKPKLLLHSCCAPCSSYCLIYLREYFDISCFYYNPNITDESEYIKRTDELVRLAQCLNNDPIKVSRDSNMQPVLFTASSDYLDNCGSIEVIKGDYAPEAFIKRVADSNLENEPEGGRRCSMCFTLRLSEACKVAIEGGFDYYTTSLTISPLKNAALLNEIGMQIAKANDEKALWLPSDFKKKNGYKLSTQLSERYGLYRQNYCGCEYSKRD